MKKTEYIAVHDYGMGSVGIRIFARSKEDVEDILPKPKWKIYSPQDRGLHPSFLENLPESDIDQKSPLLQRYLRILKQESVGKKPIPVRGRHNGRWEYRYIWAKSVEDVNKRFPSLELRYNVPFPNAEYSDVDVKDDFISRHEVSSI